MIPKNVRPGATAEGLTGERQSFTIKPNGKAFRTLIDGLYSNKIRAVQRELSSNARDAHIDAGTTHIPFEVSIPTSLDPTFRVRDYGTGLSHENMMRLYTTIFESTKEDTNEQTGQLGLGSKSPFAYTDTFSVISYFNGERRVYIAFLETDGVPCITHVSTDLTTEQNGLEVSFPAKRDDLSEFAKEMQFVALGYPAGAIKVHGLNLKIGEPRLQGDTWAMYPADQIPATNGSRTNYVRMGTVVYPVEARLSDVDQFCWGAVVDIPIGTADVTASREALSMDNDTRATIREAFIVASTEITAQVMAEVNKVGASRRQKALAFSKYGSILNSLRGRDDVSLLVNEGMHVSADAVVRVPGDVLMNAFFFGKASNARGGYRSQREITAFNVAKLDTVRVILDDPSLKVVRRFKRIQNLGDRYNMHVLVYSSPIKADRLKAKAWIKECWELKDDQFSNSEDTVDCPPPRRPAGPRKAARVLAAGQYWMSRSEGRVKSEIYGESDRGTYNYPGTMTNASQAIGFKYSWDDIFWVNAREEVALTKMGKLPADRKLDVAIEAKVKAHALKQPIDQAQTLIIVTEVVGAYNHALPVVLAEFFPDVTVSATNARQIISLAEMAKIDLRNQPIVAKVNARVKTLAEEYPLLFQRSSAEHFKHYITAVKATKS